MSLAEVRAREAIKEVRDFTEVVRGLRPLPEWRPGIGHGELAAIGLAKLYTEAAAAAAVLARAHERASEELDQVVTDRLAELGDSELEEELGRLMPQPTFFWDLGFRLESEVN